MSAPGDRTWECGHTSREGKRGICQKCWTQGELTRRQLLFFQGFTCDSPEEVERLMRLVTSMLSLERNHP